MGSTPEALRAGIAQANRAAIKSSIGNSSSFAQLLARPNLAHDIEREFATRRLGEFVRQAWHVVEPSTPFIPNWHIDAMAEHLEAVSRGEIRNLLINVPPRHAKSLLVSVFWPVWEWIRWPERRWLFSSYAVSLSIRDSLKCRRPIESPWFQSHWGDRFRLTGDQNQKSRFENDKTGYRLSMSVGGTATGEGGDRIICDDPHNVQEAESDTVRKSTLDWWDTVMSTRLNDPKTAAKVIVMQRCHQEDLSGHVLRQGGWEHLCLPAEFEGARRRTSIGWSDPRTESGELLWPQRFGPEELATLKRSLGSYAAAGQLQQRPSPAEGGSFKRNWWRFYREYPRYESGRPNFAEIVMSWDMTSKDAVTSGYVVGQVRGRRGSERWFLDQVRARMDFVGTVRAFEALCVKWPSATTKLIEDKASGPAIISALRRKISGIIPVPVKGS